MKRTLRMLCALLSLLMLLSLGGCGDAPVQQQIFSMDTVMTLTAYGRKAEDGLDAAIDIINAMDQSLDPESEGGIAYQLNHANGEKITVPPQIADMLRTAYSVYQHSNGALDLSVYPIYKAWGGFKQETGRVPGSEELSALRELRHFGEMEITEFAGEANFSVWLPAGTELSFGAVAKGFAADYAIDAMKKAGVTSGIVSLGGNVQTLGCKPDGTLWTVAVEDPKEPGDYIGTLGVADAAIVTSGSYQRYFTGDGGAVYHHIINPSTGKPVENELLSVTIVCEDGTLADCLSTAMFVLGPNAAMKYWRQNGGFDMILVTNDGHVRCTTGLIEVFTLTDTENYTVDFIE